MSSASGIERQQPILKTRFANRACTISQPLLPRLPSSLSVASLQDFDIFQDLNKQVASHNDRFTTMPSNPLIEELPKLSRNMENISGGYADKTDTFIKVSQNIAILNQLQGFQNMVGIFAKSITSNLLALLRPAADAIVEEVKEHVDRIIAVYHLEVLSGFLLRQM